MRFASSPSHPMPHSHPPSSSQAQMYSGKRAWAGKSAVQILYRRTAGGERLSVPASWPAGYRVRRRCSSCAVLASCRLLPCACSLWWRPSWLCCAFGGLSACLVRCCIIWPQARPAAACYLKEFLALRSCHHAHVKKRTGLTLPWLLLGVSHLEVFLYLFSVSTPHHSINQPPPLASPLAWLQALVEACLLDDHEKRPSFEEVVATLSGLLAEAA